MYKKGKLVISQHGEHKPLLDNPLSMPCLDKSAGEYYMWHGNLSSAVIAMTQDGGMQFNFRTSIMSGCGGLFFSENSSQANLYVPCPACGLGGMTLPIAEAGACTCKKGRAHTYRMLLCRYKEKNRPRKNSKRPKNKKKDERVNKNFEKKHKTKIYEKNLKNIKKLKNTKN